MRSEATTVEEYLAELSPERRAIVETVRATILENLPAGYEEAMNWGMITYQVPLSVYPETYNGKPLMYVALVSQKNYLSLYLTGVYIDAEARQAFEAAYRATGKRMDIGKSCVRFRKLEDLPLELIGQSVAAMEMDEFVERVKQGHRPD
ncbi:MAG: iron chaperone [Anaerolineae bacterium]